MRIKSSQSYGRIKYSALKKKIYRIISLRSSITNNSAGEQQIYNSRKKLENIPQTGWKRY
jgi:hypothetical protein